MLCGNNARFDERVSDAVRYARGNDSTIIMQMASKIVEQLPCVFITHGSIAFQAAIMVKNTYPKMIKIIMVVHSDDEGTYNRVTFCNEKVTHYICISTRILEQLKNRYNISSTKLVYRPNPIDICRTRLKTSNRVNCLQVGFASRLEEKQKRCNVLIDIMQRLFSSNINCEFNIAGEGTYYTTINEFINKNDLKSKIHLYGWISPENMGDFWEKQDVYLNVSEFEGMSLTMLEAMANSVVPIVTNVSGVNDIVTNEQNGFIYNVSDINGIISRIEYLSNHIERLTEMGKQARETIQEKCDITNYCRWLDSLT